MEVESERFYQRKCNNRRDHCISRRYSSVCEERPEGGDNVAHDKVKKRKTKEQRYKEETLLLSFVFL